MREYLLGRYRLMPQHTGFIALGGDAVESPHGNRWDGVALTLFLDTDALQFADQRATRERCHWHPFWMRYTYRAGKGGRVSEGSRVCLGATLGALCGAAVAYLVFTERGRALRERIEPAADDLRQEFTRFQKTIEKVGDLANDGMRVMEEFSAARARSPYPTGTTSH